MFARNTASTLARRVNGENNTERKSKMKTLSKKTLTAVAKYGKEFCIWAAQENKDGNGANTISLGFPKDSGLQGRTRSADAAINAGREILSSM
jgi:hypothetical protein